MQLSKLTFSLASLVLISALVFATTPVMAADGGPTVSFGAKFTGTRSELKVTVTFSPAVVFGDLSTPDSVDHIGPDDLQYRLKDSAGGWITASAPFDSVVRTDTTTTGDTDDGFTFTVDITDDSVTTTGAITDARSISVQVPADVATAAAVGVVGPGLGNQASIAKTYTLPRHHTAKVSFGDATPVANMPGQFKVTVTFDSGQTANALDLSSVPLAASDFDVDPKNGATVTVGTEDSSTTGKLSYPLTIDLARNVNTVTISVDDGYAPAADMNGSVRVTTLSTLATPKKPTFTVNAGRTVSLNWDDVTDADSYTVTQKQAGEDDVTYPATDDDPITDSEYTTKALAVGTYTFTVKAMSDSALDSAASPASDSVVVSGTAPTVTVSLVSGSLNVTDKKFLVDFAFVKAGEEEADVPDMLMADYIKVTTDAAGMTDARIPNPMVAELRGDGNFRATIDYTGATLPLYVSLMEADSKATPPVMGVDVSMITYGTDATDTSLMVGDSKPVTPPVTQADPTVSIMIDMLDTSARTFRVDVTSTPGAMSDGSTPAAQPVTHGDLEVKDADDMVVMTTVVEQDTATDGTTNVSRYVAVLKYGLASNAPDSVGLKAAFDTANTVTPATFVAPNNDPTFPDTTVTTLTVAENTEAGTAIGTPVAATDTDTGDTLEYTLGGTDAASFAIVSTSGQLQTKAALEFDGATAKKSYMVTVTASDGKGGTDASIDVTINVTNDTADDGEGQTPDPGQPDETAPVVTIVPVSGEQSAAFDVTFTVIEANLATTDGVKVAITPADAVTDATPTATAGTGNAYTVNVTPKLATATNTPVAATTITITVTAMDASGNSGMDSAAVKLGERPYMAPADPDTTDPTVAITPFTVAKSAAFNVVITATDETSTLTTASIGVVVTSTNTGTATYTVGDVMAGTAANTYTVKITPTAATTADIPAETLTIHATATDAAGNDATTNTAVILAARTAPPTTTTPSATIASKGYAVFVPPMHDTTALPSGLATHTVADMPGNLADFFKTGGTIDVVVTGKAKHNVIITEIMVAEDLGKAGGAGTMRPEAGQWIELYNNTAAAISISDITLMFATGYPAAAQPANTTDRLSNTVVPGWGFEAAFAGALSGQTAINASSVRTVTKMFKSLRRKHKDNKALQNAGTVIQNGWSQGSWAITADTRVFLAGRIGTPGSENRPTVFTPTTFTAPKMNMTFSEIANRTDDGNEWIELKGPAGATLRKVKISKVTTANAGNNPGTETTVYQFPDNDDVKFPSNGILLISDRNPVDNELAATLKDGVPTEGIRYRIRTLAPLPNDGNFLLVLRDKDGKFEDVAGYATALSRDNPYTTLWPLSGNVGRIGAKNKLEADKVYRRARAIQGYSHNKDKPDETAFAKIGFTGIGYDRNAPNSDANGGTPGYPNNAYINAGTDATQQVIISEIMYSQGKTGRLAQWIELQNMSATTGVDLHNWRLYIVNHDNKDFTGKITDEIWLRGVKIPPNQTALIASSAGRNTTNLPGHRILNARRSEPLLSSTGFELRLEAKSNEGDVNKRQAGDKVSNLVDENRKSFAAPAWTLPLGIDDNGDRVSISRRTSGKLANLDGTNEWNWMPSDEDPRLSRMGSVMYYGHVSDISSPGNTVGSVLPVSLSKFRPERLDDGSIVIRWVTESELDNAGFNILRSDTRDGEFTKLNEQLIAGHGTTSERNTYDFADTSAKPNVVYYYQIQDVSLDGDVQTLRTTRLKGHISAAGKLTTTWGDLKLQD